VTVWGIEALKRAATKACGVASGEGQGIGWWAHEPATWARERRKDREIKKEKKLLGKRGIRENRKEKGKRRNMKKEISPNIT